MADLQALHRLAGNYFATSKLWMSPTEEPRSCHSDAVVTPVAQGRFLRIDYTWEFDGTPQSGSILIGYESNRNIVTAVWIDSWHMGEKYMACEGTLTDNGGVDVRGSYAAPPGPDWGWRTVIEPDKDSFRFVMYNISPDGKEDLAVEAVYRRK